MPLLNRSHENPILIPYLKHSWESKAAFNGCPTRFKNNIYLLYRALSSTRLHAGVEMELSTVGLAKSSDGIHFKERSQLIKPEYEWENFGCEDPRVTKLNGKYYIFYTALSRYPFVPEGIRIGVAITEDFKTFKKYPVTTFNSKAMALFPQKIKGKMYAILTANTDMPPAKIAIAKFDQESDIWSRDYWDKWYASIDKYTLPLQKTPNDHVEVGAPPIKTDKGWLILYSHIKDYLSSSKIFEVDGALLDLNDPTKIIGRTKSNILVPEEGYELYGQVPNIVFPSGALKKKSKLYFYYGAADTTCCLATLKLKDLVKEMTTLPKHSFTLKRFKDNPIIKPNPNHDWEAQSTFNPAAIYENNKVHIIYRAMSPDMTSVFGYATSTDCVHIDKRLTKPIYVPREDFEQKLQPGNSGCEDPRITKIGDKLYMLYTAFDGKNPPRVAITSIKLDDFLNKNWKWKKPVLISQPNISDKNACIMPEKINNKYVIFHRIREGIDMSFVDSLNFKKGQWIKEDNDWLRPRRGKWDSRKVGAAAPPIKTKHGWILIYHGVSARDRHYRLGAVLFDLKNPKKIIARTEHPILEPTMDYEKKGDINNVVFPCSALMIGKSIFIYYGAADKVIGVASIEVNKLLKKIKH